MSALYSIALAGLNASNKQAEAAASNIQRATIDGATQHRTATLVENAAGLTYVTTGRTVRIVDEIQIEALRKQGSVLGKSSSQDTYLRTLQEQLGKPGKDGKIGNTLGELLTDVKNKFESIVLRPSNSVDKDNLVDSAKYFVDRLQAIAAKIQELRRKADAEITKSITEINNILEDIKEANIQTADAAAGNTSTAVQEDNRDIALLKLAQYFDFFTTSQKNESVSVRLLDGTELVTSLGGVNKFSYAPTPNITASTTYPAGINDIEVNIGSTVTNVTNLVGSGKLSALVELRDTTLVNFQKEVDEFAVKLRNTFNSIHNLGTGYPASQTLTGTKVFANPTTTDTVTVSGRFRVAIVDNTGQNGTFNNINDFDYTVPVNMTVDAFRALIDTTPNVTATINADGKLVVQSTLANHGVAICSIDGSPATITETGQNISDYFGLNDFFVTGTNFNGDGVVDGVAEKMDIRSDILSDKANLATYRLNSAVTVNVNDVAIAGESSANARALSDYFDATVAFAAAGNLAGKVETTSSYANIILDDVAATASRLATSIEREKGIYETIETNVKNVSAISEEANMMDMMKSLTQYRYSLASFNVARIFEEKLMELVGR